MSDFDNTAFTERLAALYADQLRERLPAVKFMVTNIGTKDSTASGMFRLLGEDTSKPFEVVLDNYMRKDGGVDEEYLMGAIATGLSEPVIAYAQQELDKDDSKKRGDAGQLWVVHQPLLTPQTLGGAHVHVAKPQGIELLGQSRYDSDTAKIKYLAKTIWNLARSSDRLA